MTVHLVEDNPQVRELLKSQIAAHYPSARVAGEAQSVADGYELLSTVDADVWLLDIELVDGTVFDLLDRLDTDRVETASMVFLTAYNSYEYVVQALRKSAVEYLLKPVDPAHLCAALDKARAGAPQRAWRQQLEALRKLFPPAPAALDKLPVYLPKGVVRYLDVADILYLSADGEITHFHLHSEPGKPLTSVRNLGFYSPVLTEKGAFQQVSRACLVNTRYIRHFEPGEQQIVLTTGARLSTSRRGGRDLSAFFRRFLG